MNEGWSRRDFVVRFSGLLAAGFPLGRFRLPHRCHAASRGPHPTPRPGITAAKVPTAEQLAETKNVIPVFDQVRAIPEVIDGIRCQCGCADAEGFYSLLTCYEGTEAMARHCPICQGQGRMAARLHKDGKTLDEVRAAIDARYG